MASSFGLLQIVEETTRGDQDLIMNDLAVCYIHNRPTWALQTTTRVWMSLSTETNHTRGMFGDMTRQTSRGMRDHLASTDWPSVFQEKDPETTCRKVTDIILDSMDLFIPSKTSMKNC